MRYLNKKLENRKVDYKKLLKYGFNENNSILSFETTICDNQLKVIIEISDEKQTSKVIDLSTNEEYLLVDVNNALGDFVGKVKEEYEGILNDIIEKCSTPDIFKSKQAKEIIKYVKEKYNDDLEYLWKKFPNNAIWRNDNNNKWYGALLVINESKLGILSDEIIEIIDLRYPRDKIKEIIDNKTVFQGYHMNKDNWITIKLDESVDIKEIYKLIDGSYTLSLEK